MENECGKHDNPFTSETLSLLQRGILGDLALRYGLRRSPVYVGHSAHYQAVVDYIAPHWEQTHALLSGLRHKRCDESPVSAAHRPEKRAGSILDW